MSTRVVTGAIGAGIGFAVGGPQGAMYGWAIGSAAGSVIDPPIIKGPSVGEIAQQTTQEGVPIPIVFGLSPPIAGNLIATSEPRIVKSKSSGKGGPKVETEAIYRTYAISFCEGPIGGFLRVWRNNTKVYDALDPEFNVRRNASIFGDLPSRNEAFLYGPYDDGEPTGPPPVHFHLGTYDQDADTALEGIFGAGTTPAHRGIAYMVIVDEDVTREGGAVPLWQVQVSADLPMHYESPKLWPWVSGAIPDPRHPLNEHTYTFSAENSWGGTEVGATGGTDQCDDIGKNVFGLGSFSTLEDAVAALNAAWQDEHPGNRLYVTEPAAYSRTGNNNLDGFFSAPPTSTLNTPGAQQNAYQRYTFLHLPVEGHLPTYIGGLTTGLSAPSVGQSALVMLSGGAFDLDDGRSRVAMRVSSQAADALPEAPYQFWGTAASGTTCATGATVTYKIYSCAVARAERLPGKPSADAKPVSGTFRVLRSFLNTSGSGTGNPQRYPTGPCLRDDDENYSSQVFWEDAYARALDAGEPGVVGGWIYGADYPSQISDAFEVMGNYPTYILGVVPGLVARLSPQSWQFQMPWCTNISWSITSGALPTGLTLDSSTGLISGTPSASASYSFTISATGMQSDRSLTTKTKSYSVVVDDFPAVISSVATATPAGTTTRVVPLGISPSTGDLIFILSSYTTGGLDITPPSGFTLGGTAPGSGNTRMAYHWKVSDGSEGGSVAFTGINTARVLQHLALVIRAGTFDASRISHTNASNSGFDAPTHTPAWGSAKNLWLAATIIVRDPINNTLTTVPLRDNAEIFPGADGLNLQFGVGTKLEAGSSLAPGSFAFSPALSSVSFTKMTLAIGPP